jgi:tryptophan-rich sensory protein
VVNDYERDPFKVFVLAISTVISPIMFVRFDHLAGGTLHTFPSPFGQIFLAWLFLSSGTALYGVIRQRNVSGVLWERTGMYGVAFLFVTYGAWAGVVFGGPAFGFASLLISLGLAAIVRIRQINRRRRKAG